jgi:hypothetical protein
MSDDREPGTEVGPEAAAHAGSEPGADVAAGDEASRSGGPAEGLSEGDIDEALRAAAAGGHDDADVRDTLPADLDASGYVGPYLFPNNSRRRVPGIIYLVFAVILFALWVTHRGAPQILINDGYLAAAIGLALFGTYSVVTGWDLKVDERDALVASVRQVGFPVGHASAQMGWRGLLSRPTWRILLYSAEDPPSQRGLVLVDGQRGEVLEWFVEDNPEDWSQFEE